MSEPKTKNQVLEIVEAVRVLRRLSAENKVIISVDKKRVTAKVIGLIFDEHDKFDYVVIAPEP